MNLENIVNKCLTKKNYHSTGLNVNNKKVYYNLVRGLQLTVTDNYN